MAIDRLRSPFNNMLVVTGDVGPAAYSNAQSGGATPYTFIGTGATNTIVGVTYRVHLFTRTPGQAYTITFNRAGNVDLLVLAGGGGGGGGYYAGASQYGLSSGGGGGGGLILSYGYGVTATTYSLFAGKGGYDADGRGQYYYNNAAAFAENSTFGALTAIRGGHGRPAYSTGYTPQDGGSGGGGSNTEADSAAPKAGGNGTAGQGNKGGMASGYANPYTGGGGGGYTSAGQDYGTIGQTSGRLGGDGIALNFDGQMRTIAAGGGGGGYSSASGGLGGSSGAGGTGGAGGSDGATNASGWGNGGGGAGYVPGLSQNRGGAGTDGLVIVRYALG